MCFNQLLSGLIRRALILPGDVYSQHCQVTEWLSADVNDSQFCFSQVLKDCLGDVKGSLFVTNGDNRTTHRAIGFNKQYAR